MAVGWGGVGGWGGGGWLGLGEVDKINVDWWGSYFISSRQTIRFQQLKHSLINSYELTNLDILKIPIWLHGLGK